MRETKNATAETAPPMHTYKSNWSFMFVLSTAAIGGGHS
jgi:hypothetical protein